MFALDIIEIVVACNNFNQSVGEMKEKSTFGFRGFMEEVLGHLAV